MIQAPPQGGHFLRPEAGQLGALADADDAAVGDADRGVGEQAERIAGLRDHRRDMAVGDQAVPHDVWPLGGEAARRQSMASGWPNLSDLIVDKDADAPVGLVGAPLAAGSVTPGDCDLAPALLRATLRRIGRYDVETGRELASADRRPWRRADCGAFASRRRRAPIRDACAASVARHALTLLVGGNNAVTRPGRACAWAAAGARSG